MKRHFPNLLTSFGLLSGCIAIILISDRHLTLVPYFVWLAAFFDFIDGFAARMLQVSSEMGKQLDSLCDMVSFGVVPGYFLFALLEQYASNEFIPYFGFLVTIASAWRLAKFNIDDRQSDKFIGLPTPANAILITGLIFVPSGWIDAAALPFLIGFVLVLSYLLNAEIELIALKFKSFAWKGNEPKYILVMFSLGLLLILHFAAIPVIIVLYIIISLFSNVIYGKHNAE